VTKHHKGSTEQTELKKNRNSGKSRVSQVKVTDAVSPQQEQTLVFSNQ